MAKAAVLAAHDGDGPHCAGRSENPVYAGAVARIEEALRQRLGAERYAVWFGDAVRIDLNSPDDCPADSLNAAAEQAEAGLAGPAVPADGLLAESGWGDAAGLDGHCVVLSVSNAFSLEWLKRTFRIDVEASARLVCGGRTTVVWRTAPPTSRAAPPAQISRHQPAGKKTAGKPGCQEAAIQGAALQEAAIQEVVPRAAAELKQAGELKHPVVPKQAAGSRHSAALIPAEKGVVSVPAAASRPRGVGMRRPAAGLDGFVVGPSNRMASAAVELAAARPGEMSPLVLHGPSGVGKTHLLEGICGRFRELHPSASTLMLSAEQFTTGFLQALHGSGLPGFRRACRNADLLVIDDLQFFVGKRATLMEVQQTVDALHRQGRQMVFASDRDVAALDGLGPEIVTRLRGGMVARIEPPDYDVRHGIVTTVAAHRGLSLPEEVVHYVATHMTRHARELIGALNRLEATSHMLGMPITAGMAEESLADLVRSSARSVRLADIERAVCTAFGIESGSLQSARRARTVSHPRMLAMFLARRHTTSALTEIGSYFGRRSHSTVIAAQKTVGEWVSQRSRIVLADATWDVEEAIRRVEDVLRAG